MKFRQAIIFICMTMALSSCKMYEEVSVKEVLDVQIVEFDKEGVECKILITVFNPNWYKITLTESHVFLKFEGKLLGEVTLLENLVIPKRSQSTVEMKCDANYEAIQGLLGNVMLLLFQSEYTMKADGYIRAKALAVSKTFPVQFKETLTKEDLGF